jgi:hypothetical protein
VNIPISRLRIFCLVIKKEKKKDKERGKRKRENVLRFFIISEATQMFHSSWNILGSNCHDRYLLCFGFVFSHYGSLEYPLRNLSSATKYMFSVVALSRTFK